MGSVNTQSHPILLSTPIVDRDIKIGCQYSVIRDGPLGRPAIALDLKTTKLGRKEVYISYPGQDKRLDTWIPISDLGQEVLPLKLVHEAPLAGPSTPTKISNARKSAVNGITTSSPTRKRPEPPARSAPSTPEREHEAITRVRNFEDVRVGEYLIKTWYYSPYPPQTDELPNSHPIPPAEPLLSNPRKRKLETNPIPPVIPNGHPGTKGTTKGKERSVAEIYAGESKKAGEGSRGRLWVCDLCFKYMRTRAGWDRHSSSCTQLEPPGRRVYQRGSYTIWEVDGAQATLYCQNLSLFGKLFIDHKSVFYHVDNFLFYVLCDAATSRRDQVMAFFSKEKISYDDYNLACIVTFPPHQNRGFGKLLIEFSYYLTHHPSTRSPTFSPGTPERPLSDLGLKGYTAYWIAVTLRVCRKLLGVGVAHQAIASPKEISTVKAATTEKRSTRARKTLEKQEDVKEEIKVNDITFTKRTSGSAQGCQTIRTTLLDLAKAAHLRVDDMAFTLGELGFLRHRRPNTYQELNVEEAVAGAKHDGAEGEGEGDKEVRIWRNEEELGEWKDVEIVITRDMIDDAWVKWGVREKGVLDESCCLL